MNIGSLLSPNAVAFDSDASSKRQALKALAQLAEQVTGIDQTQIFETFSVRERLGTTDLGNGIAVPHGRFEALDRCTLLALRLSNPIAFDEDAEEPVDLLFALLVPENAAKDPQKALNCLSRDLASPSLRGALRQAENTDAFYRVIMDLGSAEQREAA